MYWLFYKLCLKYYCISTGSLKARHRVALLWSCASLTLKQTVWEFACLHLSRAKTLPIHHGVIKQSKIIVKTLEQPAQHLEGKLQSTLVLFLLFKSMFVLLLLVLHTYIIMANFWIFNQTKMWKILLSRWDSFSQVYLLLILKHWVSISVTMTTHFKFRSCTLSLSATYLVAYNC